MSENRFVYIVLFLLTLIIVCPTLAIYVNVKEIKECENSGKTYKIVSDSGKYAIYECVKGE